MTWPVKIADKGSKCAYVSRPRYIFFIGIYEHSEKIIGWQVQFFRSEQTLERFVIIL